MCGRYVIEIDDAEIREIINDAVKNLGEDNNMKTGEIFPTNKAPVLLFEHKQQKPTIMEWGFPNFRNKGVIINARAETALEKPIFRNSLLSRRCVIPTTGFYEWKENKDSKHKDKYLFTLPQSHILYIAGVYNSYEINGTMTNRFVVLTTKANRSMEDIHDRMPVVLQKDNIGSWVTNTDDALYMIQTVPPDLDKILFKS